MKNQKIKNKETVSKDSRFGRLVVTHEIGKKGKHRRFMCVCDCGEKVIVYQTNLSTGHTVSCGCYRKEKISKLHYKHGESHTRLHNIWLGIKKRCHNTNDINYHRYGGRGICVCEDWFLNFNEFKNWALNNGYNSHLTIEREDVDGDYCPNNCKWATIKEQQRNKSNTIFIHYNGVEKPLSEWAELFCMKYNCLHKRIFALNWDVKKALETPVRIKENEQ